MAARMDQANILFDALDALADAEGSITSTRAGDEFISTVKAATQCGWEIDQPLEDADGMTLLHHVCNRRSAHQTDWVNALLALGANTATTDVDGNTALTFTAMSGNAPSAAALLGARAEINHVNSRGESPLLVAAACGECAVLDVLIANGADLSTKATSGEHAGRTALVAARACMRMPAAKLIDRCAGLCFASRWRWRPLCPVELLLLRSLAPARSRSRLLAPSLFALLLGAPPPACCHLTCGHACPRSHDPAQKARRSDSVPSA